MKNENAVALGMIKSERKAAAARVNARRPRPAGRKPRKAKSINQLTCNCGSGDVLELAAHLTTDPRGRVIRYRVKKGLPLS